MMAKTAAVNIRRQDKRPNVTVSFSVKAELYEDVAVLGRIIDSDWNYTAIESLTRVCDENRTAINEWKSANHDKLESLMKPESSRRGSGKTPGKSSAAGA